MGAIFCNIIYVHFISCTLYRIYRNILHITGYGKVMSLNRAYQSYIHAVILAPDNKAVQCTYKKKIKVHILYKYQHILLKILSRTRTYILGYIL